METTFVCLKWVTWTSEKRVVTYTLARWSPVASLYPKQEDGVAAWNVGLAAILVDSLIKPYKGMESQWVELILQWTHGIGIVLLWMLVNLLMLLAWSSLGHHGIDRLARRHFDAIFSCTFGNIRNGFTTPLELLSSPTFTSPSPLQAWWYGDNHGLLLSHVKAKLGNVWCGGVGTFIWNTAYVTVLQNSPSMTSHSTRERGHTFL